jgi:putative phage-type endonuclease
MLTPAQQEQRLDGITATDVSAILGQNPYRSAIDVFREKRGESVPHEDTERSRWGTLLEPVIRADYEQRHGVTVTVPATLAHHFHQWALATPDGIVLRDGAEDRGLEIKCHTIRLAHMYGADGSDEVPPHELCQCMWGMAVTGLPSWDLVAFIDNQPREFTITRDDELIGIMIERADRFLVDNVRGGAQPEPDGSEAYTDYLKAKWKTNTANLIDIGDDNDTFDLIERGKLLREEISDRETVLESIVQTLKTKIGDQAGLTWKDAKGKPLRVQWKHSKERRWVDTVGIMNDMRHAAALITSAKTADIERALVCLATMKDEPVGRSTRGFMAANELSELISAMRDTLTAVAKNATEAQRTSFSTSRPFLWPSSWKAPKAKEQ